MGFWKRVYELLMNEDGYATPGFPVAYKYSIFANVKSVLSEAGKKIKQAFLKDAKHIFPRRNAKILPFCSTSRGGTVIVRALPAILVVQNYDINHELLLRPQGLYIYARCTHRSLFLSARVGDHYDLDSETEIDPSDYVKYGLQAAKSVS